VIKMKWAVALNGTIHSRHHTFERAHQRAQRLIRARGSARGVVTVWWDPEGQQWLTPLGFPAGIPS